MRLTADEYFQASQDHIEEARLLLNENKYAYSHFTAGLAVECMFRAYAVRNGAAFDGKHDLRNWFALARFDEVIRPVHAEQIAAAYDIVVLQWNSTQRYYSEGFLRAHFRNNRFDRGIRGNTVKELTRRLVEAAFEVVTEGKLRWMSKLTN